MPAPPLVPPVRAAPVALPPAATLGDVLRAVFRNGLDQLAGNRTGVLAGDDPEYLHQMRVAVRRLRSAIRLFPAALPPEEALWLGNELTWLGGVLGEARDWDVFHEDVLTPLLAFRPGHPGLAALGEAVAQRRQRASRAARAALRSPRWRALIHALTEWAEGRRTGPEEQRFVRPLAEKLLARCHRRLRRRGHHLASLPPAARHRARIAAKKLRYAVEFLASLFPPETVRPYIKRLGVLQDVLGTLNDVAVAEACLDELLPPSPGLPLLRGIALAELANQQRARAAHAGLAIAWKRFPRTPPFHPRSRRS